MVKTRQIKAIPVFWTNPTTGIETRFDSTTEARFAVFFYHLGIECRRETQAFGIGKKDGRNRGYLPDYWLPQLEVWAEIKGPGFTDDELWKAERLAVGTGYPVLLLFDQPGFKAWEMFRPERNEAILYECLITTDELAAGRLPMWEAPARTPAEEKKAQSAWEKRLRANRRYRAAVEAALTARFKRVTQ